MNFSTIAIGAGLVAMVAVSQLQNGPALAFEDDARATRIDPQVTGSIETALAAPRADLNAIRLIDLRNGMSCRAPRPLEAMAEFEPAPLGADCAISPDLGQVTQWRLSEEGSLDMADSSGRTVMRFMPGDGVLFESTYPSNALVTIVPARG